MVEEFEGMPYSVIEMKSGQKGKAKEQGLYVSLADGLFIFALKEKDIKDFLGKLKPPSKEKTLASSPKYLDTAEELIRMISRCLCGLISYIKY